eukprot:scaffold34_cov260-Pinguiococcus_pyrenoidosus.AAC.21
MQAWEERRRRQAHGLWTDVMFPRRFPQRLGANPRQSKRMRFSSVFDVIFYDYFVNSMTIAQRFSEIAGEASDSNQ